jgi:hypothetical protein
VSEARNQARALTAELDAAAPELLTVGGISLRPALEQHLYLRLAAGRGPAASRADRLPAHIAVGLAAADAVLRGLAGRLRRPSLGGGEPLSGAGAVLVLAGVHCRIWRPIGEGLVARGYLPFATVRAARLRGVDRACGPTADLAGFLDAPRAATLARLTVLRSARLTTATPSWAALVPPESVPALRAATHRSLARLTAQALRLEGFIERRRPSLLITFAELSEWARIVPAVARVHDVPTLGLPHAEAADADALAGLDYDRLAVFGPRAAAIVEAAGYPRDRIVQIGAPHFDYLAARVPSKPVTLRRIVFASQYTGGRMTLDVKRETLLTAIAIAAAVGPAELVVKRHPVETDHVVDEVLAAGLPDGVSARVVDGGAIGDMLDGAWLLVTGWSNSVLEAALLEVPAITLNATAGADPVTFAADGLSLGAVDRDGAVSAARGLLDPMRRAEAIAVARSRLVEHLGPLDGRAAERAADLIESMAGMRLPRRADS